MVSKAHIKAVTKYDRKAYDKITLRLKKGEKEKIQVKATSEGESLNGYIVKAINEKMEK